MATERLFHQDAYQKEFAARVTRLVQEKNRLGVELDRTAFYATAGGQPHDTGTINGHRVVDVTDEDGTILHWLEPADSAAPAGATPTTAASNAAPSLSKGDAVTGVIDWARRFDHTQQHSGQHILSGALWTLLQAETVSFHMGADSSTIDLEVADLTPEQVRQVTALANKVVWEDRPILIHWADTAEEAARLPLRKPPKVLTGVRVVEVEGFDFSACGGTHPQRAGEVGPILVRRWERYKGGTRVEFLCGGRAVADYEQQNAITWEVSRLLSVGVGELSAAVGRLQEQTAELRRNWEKARTLLLEQEAEALWQQGEELPGGGRLVAAHLGERPLDEVKALALGIAAHPSAVALLGTATGGRAQLLFQRAQDLPVDLNQLLRSVLPHLEGRGGGQPASAQGGGPKLDGLETALSEAAVALRDQAASR